jgi:hypothetical protein
LIGIRRIASAAAGVSHLYTKRGWVILGASALLFWVVYRSSETLAHVYDPPVDSRAIDTIIPVDGLVEHRWAGTLGVEIGVDGCLNPVKVIVALGVSAAGRKRN